MSIRKIKFWWRKPPKPLGLEECSQTSFGIGVFPKAVGNRRVVSKFVGNRGLFIKPLGIENGSQR